MKNYTFFTAEGIYKHIISNIDKFRPDVYTCIIAGKPGPTGKTWITSKLNSMGYTAIEITEPLLVSNSISINDEKNHLIIDEFRKSIVIILNCTLEQYDKKVAKNSDDPVSTLNPETSTLNIVLHTNEVSDPDAALAEIFKHIQTIKGRMINLSIM